MTFWMKINLLVLVGWVGLVVWGIARNDTLMVVLALGGILWNLIIWYRLIRRRT